MSKKTYKKLIWGKWINNGKIAYVFDKEGVRYDFCEVFRDKSVDTLEPYFICSGCDSKDWKITMATNKEKRMMKHVEDCFKTHCNNINYEYKSLIEG